MDEDEWTTICGMLQRYDQANIDFKIPRTTIQHEIIPDLTVEEDPIAPTERKPAVKCYRRND